MLALGILDTLKMMNLSVGQEDKQESAKAKVKYRGRGTTFYPALSYPWDICELQGRVNAFFKSSLWVPGTLSAPRSMYWGVCPEDHTQSRLQLSEHCNILPSDGTTGQSFQRSIGIHFPHPCQHFSFPVFISFVCCCCFTSNLFWNL